VSNNRLRLAFAGTPQLAATILSTLVEQKRHELVLVITQPDRPAGRGRLPAPSPVKKLAGKFGLQINQPNSKTDIDPDNILEKIDVLVVTAFGMILPSEILYRPRLGCINVHMSLLPRWRGAAPIQRAIQTGDVVTGATIMQIDEGLDTGDILLQKECSISPDETAATLLDKLATIGGEGLLEALDGLAEGTVTPRKQDEQLATYAHKVSKEDALIDWRMSAQDLERMIRAFNPVPVAHTVLQGISMRVWEADVIPMAEHYSPGAVINFDTDGIVVAASQDAIRIKRLQLSGKNIISVRDFLNGYPDSLKRD